MAVLHLIYRLPTFQQRRRRRGSLTAIASFVNLCILHFNPIGGGSVSYSLFVNLRKKRKRKRKLALLMHMHMHETGRDVNAKLDLNLITCRFSLRESVIVSCVSSALGSYNLVLSVKAAFPFNRLLSLPVSPRPCLLLSLRWLSASCCRLLFGQTLFATFTANEQC